VSGISFGAPLYLVVLLLLLPAVGYALFRWERARASLLRRFGDESLLARSSALPSRRGRRLGALTSLAVLALVLVALARPQWGERPSSMGRQGRDVLVLLDLSRSMNAADAGRVRLSVAKQLVKDVLAQAPGHRFGLVVFGGSAFLQLPLTTNYAAFQRFLDAASTDDLGDPATDLSSALSAAGLAFEHDGEKGYQSVLLVSDGENGPGDLNPALGRLRKNHIPVLAVGVGGTEGAPVPADSSEKPEKWHRDNIGRIVISRLEEGDLRRAARETAGRYYRWSPGTARELALELSRLERRTITGSEPVERVDRFQWPLALAVGLLLLASLASVSPARAPLMSASGLFSSAVAILIAGCSLAQREIGRGQRSYEAGSYREALTSFRRAFERSGDPALQYAMGNAMYRMRRYEEAARSYRQSTGIPRLRQASYYNLGNAYVRAAEDAPENQDRFLSEAISAYQEALRLEPHDSAAKWNLELALKRKGEDRESGGSSGRGRSADYGRGNMSVPGYEGNPEAAAGAMAGGGYGAGEGESAEELSETQARQLLETVEREQLSSHQGTPSLGRGSREHDW